MVNVIAPGGEAITVGFIRRNRQPGIPQFGGDTHILRVIGTILSIKNLPAQVLRRLHREDCREGITMNFDELLGEVIATQKEKRGIHILIRIAKQ